ncbi:MAG: hypothetical protein FWE80_03905, partial [Oscillospiraceae bacterium]|nr:hypothetical protein [Oscillospiraceae bacterium]
MNKRFLAFLLSAALLLTSLSSLFTFSAAAEAEIGGDPPVQGPPQITLGLDMSRTLAEFRGSPAISGKDTWLSAKFQEAMGLADGDYDISLKFDYFTFAAGGWWQLRAYDDPQYDWDPAPFSKKILADWVGSTPYTVSRYGGTGGNDNIFDWQWLQNGSGNLLDAGLDRSEIYFEVDFDFAVRDYTGTDIGPAGYAALPPLNPRFNLRDNGVSNGYGEKRYSAEFNNSTEFVYGKNTLTLSLADIIEDNPSWAAADDTLPKAPFTLNGSPTEAFDVTTNPYPERSIDWGSLIQARFNLPAITDPAYEGYTLDFTVNTFRIVHNNDEQAAVDESLYQEHGNGARRFYTGGGRFAETDGFEGRPSWATAKGAGGDDNFFMGGAWTLGTVELPGVNLRSRAADLVFHFNLDEMLYIRGIEVVINGVSAAWGTLASDPGKISICNWSSNYDWEFTDREADGDSAMTLHAKGGWSWINLQFAHMAGIGTGVHDYKVEVQYDNDYPNYYGTYHDVWKNIDDGYPLFGAEWPGIGGEGWRLVTLYEGSDTAMPLNIRNNRDFGFATNAQLYIRYIRFTVDGAVAAEWGSLYNPAADRDTGIYVKNGSMAHDSYNGFDSLSTGGSDGGWFGIKFADAKGLDL